jgi:hypothetical protein
MDFGNLSTDTVLSALFALGAAETLGIGDFELLSVALDSTFYAAGGVDVAWASALSLLALLGAWVVNDPSLDTLSTETQALAVASVGIVLVGAISPSTLDPLTVSGGSLTIASIVWAIESGGFWALGTSNS